MRGTAFPPASFSCVLSEESLQLWPVPAGGQGAGGPWAAQGHSELLLLYACPR